MSPIVTYIRTRKTKLESDKFRITTAKVFFSLPPVLPV